jgi:methylmalonyl-CoA/ethylmalonyl-CoA epimerase
MIAQERYNHSVFAFHHLGVAVRSISQALPFYEQILGYRMTSGPFTDPIQRVTVCFLEREHNGEVVELIEPAAEESPIQQVLKRGGGAYHTCYTVPDLEVALQTCLNHGCLLISGPSPAVAFEGRRIVWLHLPSRHLLELVETTRP